MEVVVQTLNSVFEPFTFLMLLAGVATGLVIGVVPGLGGLFGMALLVPLTYQMEPIAAFALLLGMGSVTTTSDTIPAILIGVPGSVGAVATVEDGHPLAKKNEAPRAFGAAYSASLIGGLFGALVLAMSIPIMQPLILLLKTPDFLAISVAGLFFVSLVSGKYLVKGLAATLLGTLVSFVGIDGQTATERFTFGHLYFWDGLSLGIVFLGIFGMPALMDLAQRQSVVMPSAKMRPRAVMRGVKETLSEWRLVLSCSFSGSLLGAIPGIGLSVIEWVAYGIGKRHRKNGPKFGHGNIRGVIAPESANNAKEGGALIPTIAIGLPGSASMSILLGAFIVHGLVPGPNMLTNDLSITYSMIFFVAAANVLGAITCLVLTNQLSKIASIPSFVIVPFAMVFVTLGAFQNNVTWLDCAVLVVFGFIGVFMKENDWPRAAFSLGFVLGPSIERYFFLSTQITGYDWIWRPSIMVVALFGIVIIARYFFTIRQSGSRLALAKNQRLSDFVGSSVLALGAAWIIFDVTGMPFGASIFPLVCASALIIASIVVILQSKAASIAELDTEQRTALSGPTAQKTSFIVAMMPAVLVCLVYSIGYLLGVVLFVMGCILWAQPRQWRLAISVAAACGLLAFIIFDVLISIAWPQPLLGSLVVQLL